MGISEGVGLGFWWADEALLGQSRARCVSNCERAVRCNTFESLVMEGAMTLSATSRLDLVGIIFSFWP
jgi:hypothetical protein